MFLKKTFKSLLAFVLVFLMMASFATKAEAGFDASNCRDANYTVNPITFDDNYAQGYGNISIDVEAIDLDPSEKYFLAIFRAGSATMWRTAAGEFGVPNGSKIMFNADIPDINDSADNAEVYLMRDEAPWPNTKLCQVGTVNIKRPVEVNCDISITQQRDVGGTKSCEITKDANRCVEKGSGIKVSVKMKDINGNPVANQRLNVDISQDRWCAINCYGSGVTDAQGISTVDLTPDFYPDQAGNFRVRVSLDTLGGDYQRCADVNYNLTEGQCMKGAARSCEVSDGLQPIVKDEEEDQASPYKLCDQIPNPSLQAQCETCAGGPFGRDGVWTAVGCIKRDPKSIIKSLMQLGIGMGGGVALLSTLAGGFILSTSQGDPSKANQAKEIITNSIIGLLFIIFSVVILQFIGVTIFNIPGFGAVK